MYHYIYSNEAWYRLDNVPLCGFTNAKSNLIRYMIYRAILGRRPNIDVRYSKAVIAILVIIIFNVIYRRGKRRIINIFLYDGYAWWKSTTYQFLFSLSRRLQLLFRNKICVKNLQHYSTAKSQPRKNVVHQIAEHRV